VRHVPCDGVAGEPDGVLGLAEREPEALDVAGGVGVAVDDGLRQDELGGLDAVEDGDDDLARLDDGGELVEAVVRVEVVLGEDGHGDLALPDALVDARAQPVARAHGLVVQEGADPAAAELQQPVVQQARQVVLGVHPAMVDEDVVRRPRGAARHLLVDALHPVPRHVSRTGTFDSRKELGSCCAR
jgi:hypothetical protein